PVRQAPLPAPSTALPARAATGWMDLPLTAGTWTYAAQGRRTEASFLGAGRAPLARLRCLGESGRMVLSLPESGAVRPVVTIRTETATRALAAQTAEREMTVTLEARDPLLDAMALSKGRFAVESEGLAPLYLPSWAEVSRVIEDCR
ncbi:hypothetical protein, partial [Erythrobacter sp. WG]|uniref:hypothetical protein n=1 Tax=Erythrobacter sp. WG TaxID=2985510 RepID=UPI00226E9F4F